MKAFYSLLLLLAVVLTSCDEVLGTQDQIELSDGTSTSLVVSADENLEAIIKFTADASWSASVEEVASSKVGESLSWLKLSSYGGEAGECTITVSLTKNFTGASRKAEIKIVCGESEVIITVEQKGETSAGTVAKQIKEIIYNETDNSSVDVGNSQYEEEYSLKFSYYDDGSVARIVKEGSEKYNSGKYTRTMSFDYSIVGEIQAKLEEVESGSSESDETRYVISLDDRGNAVEVRKKDEYESSYRNVAKFGYTDDVRLAKILTYEYGNEDDQYIFSYENGLMSKYFCDGEYENDDEYTFDNSYYANKYPNNGMIDMMAYVGGGFEFDFLFYIGRLAKTSDFCLEKIPGFGDEMSDGNISIEDERCKEPNKLIEVVTGKSAEYSEEAVPVEYTFDEDKNLTGVTISIPYKIYNYSYEIWTTDSFEERIKWDEEKQEEVIVRYYYTTTKNRKSEYVKSGNDYYRYTINY